MDLDNGNQEMKNSLHYNAMFFSLMCVMATCIYLIYLMVFPLKVVIFHEHPFPVMKKILTYGEVVPYRLHITKHVDTYANVTARFVNDMVYTIPDYTAYRKKGTYNIIAGSVTVPGGLYPGQYKLEITYRYQVNWLRNVVITVETEKFEVRESKKAGE